MTQVARRVQLLGVIGTMVWDTIWREAEDGSQVPGEEWGGICYALAAADGAPAWGFKVRPIIRIGRDLAERGFQFLDGLSVIETRETVDVADAPNPRVELRYTGIERSCERLRGGVPAWSWSELAPRVEGCDALYVNFITGDEFGLEVAQQLRHQYKGPIYADIHSLMLSTGPKGERKPRALDRWPQWLSCFDAVQVNENELESLAGGWADPWAFAADVVGRQPRLLFVTLGEGGAAYAAAHDAIPFARPSHERREEDESVRRGRVEVDPVEGGDPTGCGDVWGMTAFHTLMRGAGVDEAVRAANAAAGINVSHHGATGLSQRLRSHLEGD